MKKILNRSVILAGIILSFIRSQEGAAWENHTLCSIQALSVLPEVTRFPDVQVESLESFLRAEKLGLTQLLDQEEIWARQTVPNYPSRPETLRFDTSQLSAEEEQQGLQQRFLYAIRVNPTLKLPSFVQELPGFVREGAERSVIEAAEFTLFPKGMNDAISRYVRLNDGEKVDALNVIATASDEPDYGLDINLWEDNPSEFAKLYQFGKQPFGNPILDFASQAPFHMGFFHEPRLAVKAAAYLSRTYPEYRIHMFQSLAQYAIKTGHPYWGLRFAGWGLHYVGDLSQPYHARSLPGVGLMRMLFLGGLDLIGIHGPMKDQIQLVTNEHLAIENFQYQSLIREFVNKADENRASNALKNSENDSNYREFDEKYPRYVVSLEAADIADHVHTTLISSLPQQIQDPKYLFATTDPKVDVYKWVSEIRSDKSKADIQGTLAKLMVHLGSHSRNYVRSILVAPTP